MKNRVNVLGVGISVLNLRTALEAIAEAVRARRKGYICVTGVHGVIEVSTKEKEPDAIFFGEHFDDRMIYSSTRIEKKQSL